ncbi:hypothetical protein AMATHDRAFT_4710 [Amanita thiersii Skay4041]|uniref:DH domain-containing protein n=1 Tax=Amanita thiersii Skay4041 TaxID=703135 RepID=A0A2A9NF41_9AGAR|nr:hypothetical protein AMATHDRAFT_4710 [Amanita thiersii Skay4041]
MSYQPFVPVSCHLEQSNTTTLEFGDGVKERSTSRSKLPLASKSNFRTKRQSQILGVPLLETQLIPSLRDTIDRMTRPPPRVASSFSSSAPPELPNNYNIPLIPPCSPAMQPISPLSCDKKSGQSVEMTISNSKLAPKKLKSALRSPKCPSPSVTSPQDSPSLRSVKSILMKKPKTPTCETPPTPKSTKSKGISSDDYFKTEALSHSSKGKSRNRSYTDPGLQTETTCSQEPNLRATSPECSEPVTPDVRSTPKKLIRRQKSNIPRPASTWSRRTPITSGESVTEDSDLEIRYEVETRNRRRLTVANAEVFPSSSSASFSETNVESETNILPMSPGVYTVKYDPTSNPPKHPGRACSGLGLDFNAHTDGITKCETTNTPIPIEIKNDHSSFRSLSTISNSSLMREHERRRNALLKIVSGLQLDQKSELGEKWYSAENDPGKNSAFPSSFKKAQNDALYEDDDASQYDDSEVDEPNNTCLYDPPPEPPSFVISSTPSNEAFTTHPNSTLPHTVESLVCPDSAQDHAIRGKSPSRSPVIRNNIAASSVPISPAALKRRSMYLDMPEGYPPNEPAAGIELSKRVKSPSGRTSNTAEAATVNARRAFGIPLSELDDVHEAPCLRVNRSSLAESEFSSAGSTFWRAAREDEQIEEGNELSPGAASLFRKLSDGANRQHENRAYSSWSADPSAETFSTESLSSSASSLYEGEYPAPEQRSMHYQCQGNEGREHDTRDEMEQNRREVIKDLCESEETFVARLHVCVQLFILPLRIRNSKTWVNGVPPDIARFLDWFEDIANLHMHHVVQVVRSIQDVAIRNHSGTLICVSEPLLPLIPRLEVYQPYLVRLSSIINMLACMLRGSNDDFGEFVNIQQKSPACGGWKLESFLLEPMNRLTRYCDMFSRLLSYTSKWHPDYLPTFSALKSIDVIVRVMTEVKAREDEYQMIKNIASKIQGNYLNFRLPRRDRRLFHKGPLCLLKDGSRGLEYQEEEIPQTFSDKEPTGSRMSRLAAAVKTWDFQRERSDSVRSGSTAAGLSIRSTQTTNSRALLKSSHGVSGSCGISLVQAFVFSDLLILAKPLLQADGDQTYQLVPGMGASRVFHAEVDECEDGPVNVMLELIPLNEEDLTISSMTINTVHCCLSQQQQRNEVAQWRSALQKSTQSTIRSLAYPGIASGASQFQQQDQLATPTTNMADPDFPVPKSPSAQIMEVRSGQMSGDPVRQEREERGYWNVRFQQVLKEMYPS